MLLWICFAVLTAAVVACLMQPLRVSVRAPAIDPAAADLAVYRDQLEELEAEHARGQISADEIEAARVEVARRLIKRAEVRAPENGGIKTTPELAPRIYFALASLVPLVTVAIYLVAGAPSLPSRPYAERQTKPAEEATIADVIARIEERLRTHPDDGQGWDVVAPVYLRLGRYADAAHSYAQANRLLGETTKRLLGFAEATLLAETGIVSEPVRQAALRILQIEPDRIEPRLWLTLAKEQDGDLKGASDSYRALLADAPADAPWRNAVSERISMLTRKLAGEPVADLPAMEKTDPAPGSPSPQDTARVQQMSPEDRQAFINKMVEGLAARLKTDGKDLQGWLKLARAYKVLGRETDAAGAMADARRNFAGDQNALAEIDAAAKSIGP
ncbi:MAG: c-type cytochrome biogenesis protein CcmI [Hyphomicrobium sp.]|jgi:cytochrome c-type biogenesis protein CcmH